MTILDRARWAGVVGPAGFVGAWVLGGTLADDYSPVQDAISRLAAVDAPTRGLMNAGFTCFGLAVPVFASALRREGGTSWVAATGAGVFTLGVALVPLGASPGRDMLHGVLAGAGYVALALTPVLASSTLRAQGRNRAAKIALFIGAVAGVSLAATVLGPAHGLFQRLGLTTVDAWLVWKAVSMARDDTARPDAALRATSGR